MQDFFSPPSRIFHIEPFPSIKFLEVENWVSFKFIILINSSFFKESLNLQMLAMCGRVGYFCPLAVTLYTTLPVEMRISNDLFGRH